MGRHDFQMKIRGFRIDVVEIEAALRRDSKVSAMWLLLAAKMPLKGYWLVDRAPRAGVSSGHHSDQATEAAR